MSIPSYVPHRFRKNPVQDERLSELVETLRARLEEASLSLSSLEEERARLESQVEAREEEIARLGRQIGSDSNLEKVISKADHLRGCIQSCAACRLSLRYTYIYVLDSYLRKKMVPKHCQS